MCGMYEAVYVNDIIMGVILFDIVPYYNTYENLAFADNMTHLYLYHKHRCGKPFNSQ